MSINKNNYELYFINFLDGKLKHSEIEELNAFLLIHPELKEELEEMQEFGVELISEKEEITFNKKYLLNKSISDKVLISEKNIDEFLITYLENDLEDFDIKRLELFLKENPIFTKNFDALKKTYLKPDLTISYKNKSELKKFVISRHVKMRKLIYTSVSVAAVITLLFNVFLSDFPTLNTYNYGRKVSKNDIPKTNHIANQNDITVNQDNEIAEVQINRGFRAEKFADDSSLKPNYATSRNSSTLDLTNSSYLAYENRNEFSDIYHYIKQSEYNQIDEDFTDVVPDAPRKGFIRYTAEKLFAGNNSSSETGEKTGFGLWDAVDIGTYGINSLANKEIVNVNVNEQNNKRSINLALGDNFSFSRNNRK
ncbi:MAG: hypothetical protein PHT69_04065 [Bacteroidales bacterium]|nr:hypothetical protein [Bacteroidales bacterium]